jgi:hypothetical protein
MAAPPLVPEAGRHPLFAAPVPAAREATASDQLVAFLGRSIQAQRGAAAVNA